jgi:hypothetical protein
MHSDTYGMTHEEAQALVDSLQHDLWPQLRRAMYAIAAVSAFVGAATALIVLYLLAASQ